MKHLSFIAVLILLGALAACSAPASPTAQPTLDPSNSSKIIRVAFDPSLPPFERASADGNRLVGFDVDLMLAIGSKAGFKVESVVAELSRVYNLVGDCQVDAAISAIPITEELAYRFDFSEPYYTTGQIVVVKKGNIKITGRDTLAGMTVGTQAGTLAASVLQDIPGAMPKLNGTIYASFEDLVTGSIDAVIVDKPRALSYVKIKPNNLKTVGSEFGAVNYGIAVCKGRSDLLQQINDNLQALKADGTLSRLVQKWITSSIR